MGRPGKKRAVRRKGGPSQRRNRAFFAIRSGTAKLAWYVGAMVRTASLLSLLTLHVLLGGCASAEGRYPSLAIRDIERAQGQFEAGEPKRINVPPVEVDLAGGLEARLTSLVAMAEAAHSDFSEIVPRARQLASAASGSGIGSDSWAAAQVALAELDSARSRAAVPLGDIDMIYTSAKVAAQDTAAIETARDRVIALVSEEDATLARLRAQVR